MSFVIGVNHFNGDILEIRLVHATTKFQFQSERIHHARHHKCGVVHVCRDQQWAALVVEGPLGDQNISTVVIFHNQLGGARGDPCLNESDHRILAAGGGRQRGELQ